MDRRAKIIEQIQKNGEEKIAEINEKAQNEVNEILARAKSEQKATVEQELKLYEKKNKNQIKRTQKDNLMQQNIKILQEKNNLIDKIFDDVLENLKALKAKEYKQFISNLLEKAENGDEVVISSRKGEKTMIEALPVFKKKKLKVKDVCPKMSGGVVICNKICDVDYSFEGLIKEKKEQSIQRVAKLLF